MQKSLFPHHFSETGPGIGTDRGVPNQRGLNQCFGSGLIDFRYESSILGWIPIRIQGFDDQNWKKFTTGKNVILFWSKSAIYLSLGLHKGRPPAFKREHPALQNMKFKKKFYLRGSFCPDSETGSGHGSNDLVESWSETLYSVLKYPCY